MKILKRWLNLDFGSNGLSAADIPVDAENSITDSLQVIQEDILYPSTAMETGESFTLNDGQSGLVIHTTSNSEAVTVTMPDTLSYPDGKAFSAYIIQEGDAVVSVVGSGGMTVYAPSGVDNPDESNSTWGKYTKLHVYSKDPSSCIVMQIGAGAGGEYTVPPSLYDFVDFNDTLTGNWTAYNNAPDGWRFSNNTTATANTGPDTPHEGYYIYIEGSGGGRTVDDTWTMEYNNDLSKYKDLHMSLYLHKYSSDAADAAAAAVFSIQVFDGTSWSSLLDIAENNVSDQSAAFVYYDIAIPDGTQRVRVHQLRAVNSARVDTAIDEITLYTI